MGIVFWHFTMSLDGFIAAPHDGTDWIFEYARPTRTFDEVVRGIGAIVAGRRSYEVGRRNPQGAYGGAWSGPMLVLTHRATEAPEGPHVTFHADGIAAVVARARVAAAGKDVVLFGASVARQAIDAGLVDELLVHIVPTLLGDGLRLFTREGAERVRLEKTFAEESGPVTTLRFRVRR